MHKMSLTCSVCNKVYSTRYNLNKHLRIVHNIKPKTIECNLNTKYRCIDCSINFNFNSELRKHLEKNHNLENIVEELTFKSYSAFTLWLSEEQNLKKVQYVQNSGKKLYLNEFEKLYFECRRSYRSRKTNITLKENRKRSFKSQGLCKLEQSCTSQIILKRNIKSDECSVTYYKCHYLHDTEVQHLQISKQEKESIASKLLLGVPPKGILNATRESINDDLKRIDLLTNKDIRNIKVAYKIDVKDGCHHANDATSVDIWVQECRTTDNNPVLFYKPQGQSMSGFEDSDFCLIIMNKVQRQILSDFGNKIITIDGTHGLNAYDFELTTLLTLDQNRQGFPVAFMFSNKRDTGIYVTFFSEIRNVVGQINPQVFMSDITDTYFNAWCLVMGPVENRLLCSWHVDRAWQSNLMKISNLEKRSWVYKTIKYIQSLLNTSDFEQKFNEFLEILLGNEDTTDFGQYIQKYYLPIRKQWAYCYRTGCGINTNMHIESFHKTIKYHYLEGKKIKRLDKSIHQLMLFLRDKTVERIIYLKKGKNLENTVISRHRLALTLMFNMVQEDLNLWSLQNIENNNFYSVTKLSSTVCCSIKCTFCDICIHSFSCTCTDFVIKTSICKHIHYVVLNNNISNKSNVTEILSRNQDNTDILQLTSELTTPNNSTNKMKEKIESNCLQILKNLENNNLNNDQLKLILKNTNTSVSLCHINSNQFETKKENLYEPCNKKIKKQSSFFSTKKKNTHKSFSKASAEESKIIDEFISSSLVISRDPKNDHKYI